MFVSMFGVDEVMAMDQGMFDSYKDIDYRVWESVEPIAWIGTLTKYDENGDLIHITMTKEDYKKIIEKRGID